MHKLDIGMKFKIIDDALGKNANSLLQELGLTNSQVGVLGFLSFQPANTATQRQIELALGVSHPTTTGLVQRLEAKGYVRSYTSADDGRMKMVVLTDEGKHLSEIGKERRAQAEAMLEQGFTEVQIAQLDAMLDKVMENLGVFSQHPLAR